MCEFRIVTAGTGPSIFLGKVMRWDHLFYEYDFSAEQAEKKQGAATFFLAAKCQRNGSLLITNLFFFLIIWIGSFGATPKILAEQLSLQASEWLWFCCSAGRKFFLKKHRSRHYRVSQGNREAKSFLGWIMSACHAKWFSPHWFFSVAWR